MIGRDGDRRQIGYGVNRGEWGGRGVLILAGSMACIPGGLVALLSHIVAGRLCRAGTERCRIGQGRACEGHALAGQEQHGRGAGQEPAECSTQKHDYDVKREYPEMQTGVGRLV